MLSAVFVVIDLSIDINCLDVYPCGLCTTASLRMSTASLQCRADAGKRQGPGPTSVQCDHRADSCQYDPDATEAGVSPADAATLLGVSRQFVDRLIADGKLTHRYKPGSKHRIISITEINNLKAQREHGRNGVRRAIDALVDGGIEY